MTPGRKFALGAAAIVVIVALLIAEGVKQSGTYFLTPTQLIERTEKDPSFHEVALKVSAKVVRGSIQRDNANRRIDFAISDGAHGFPVRYVGLVPDTFTDASDIDVVVEGKLGTDGIFHATDVIAKCGSRYEAAWDEKGKKA